MALRLHSAFWTINCSLLWPCQTIIFKILHLYFRTWYPNTLSQKKLKQGSLIKVIFHFFLSHRVECSPMVRETGVQSQVESYQRLQKLYLILSCLTLSIITYGSRVKWSNPGKWVMPSPTPWCSSYCKRDLQVSLNYGRQLYFLLILIKFRPSFWLNGTSTIVGYSMPNPFLCQ